MQQRQQLFMAQNNAGGGGGGRVDHLTPSDGNSAIGDSSSNSSSGSSGRVARSPAGTIVPIWGEGGDGSVSPSGGGGISSGNGRKEGTDRGGGGGSGPFASPFSPYTIASSSSAGGTLSTSYTLPSRSRSGSGEADGAWGTKSGTTPTSSSAPSLTSSASSSSAPPSSSSSVASSQTAVIAAARAALSALSSTSGGGPNEAMGLEGLFRGTSGGSGGGSATTSSSSPPPTAAAPTVVASPAGQQPNGTEDVIALPHRSVALVQQVVAVGAVSWRGRNPAATKINQDAVVVAEHGPTGSLLVAVFDGHGVNGREVSSWFRERYPLALFTDRRFAALQQQAGGGSSPLAQSSAAAAVRAATSIAGNRGGLRVSAADGGDDDNSSLGSPDSVGGQSSFSSGGASSSFSSPTAGRRSGGASTTPGSAITSGVAAALSLVDVMADVLSIVETSLLTTSGINCALSGSTAVILLIRNGFVHTVNVGDSRAILASAPKAILSLTPSNLSSASAASTLSGNPVSVLTAAVGGGAAIAAAAANVVSSVLDAPPFHAPSARVHVLTVDHKPEHPKEKARIIAMGGRVMATRVKASPHLLGPPRVWLKNAPVPGLNMSRSMGDLVGKQAGVVSTPHKALDALRDVDRVLVLGSDGLWDYVPNSEVAAVALSTENCWEAAARLARLTRARWLVRSGGADDTTVVVVRLGVSLSAPPPLVIPPVGSGGGGGSGSGSPSHRRAEGTASGGGGVSPSSGRSASPALTPTASGPGATAVAS